MRHHDVMPYTLRNQKARLNIHKRSTKNSLYRRCTKTVPFLFTAKTPRCFATGYMGYYSIDEYFEISAATFKILYLRYLQVRYNRDARLYRGGIRYPQACELPINSKKVAAKVGLDPSYNE